MCGEVLAGQEGRSLFTGQGHEEDCGDYHDSGGESVPCDARQVEVGAEIAAAVADGRQAAYTIGA